jgi:hypothetical protein
VAAKSIYSIESYGNGIVFLLVRISDGASIFLQGDDALRLSDELEQTTEWFSDDDVAEQYFESQLPATADSI